MRNRNLAALVYLLSQRRTKGGRIRVRVGQIGRQNRYFKAPLSQGESALPVLNFALDVSLPKLGDARWEIGGARWEIGNGRCRLPNSVIRSSHVRGSSVRSCLVKAGKKVWSAGTCHRFGPANLFASGFARQNEKRPLPEPNADKSAYAKAVTSPRTPYLLPSFNEATFYNQYKNTPFRHKTIGPRASPAKNCWTTGEGSASTSARVPAAMMTPW